MSLPPITHRDTIGIRDNTQPLNAPTINPKIQPNTVQKQVQTHDKNPIDYSNIPASSTVNTSNKPFELSDKEIDAIVKQALSTPVALQNSTETTPFQNQIAGVLKSQGHPSPRALVASAA